MVSVFVPVVVITLVVAGLVAFAAVRGIAVGLERLSQSARRLAEGHFDERIQRSETSVERDELGQLARAFNTMAGELEQLYAGLERQVAERTTALAQRTRQMEAAARVARGAAEIRDVEELLQETVDLISDHFDFYHAGIFLLDERSEYVVLRAASSEGGQRMLARDHRLRVASPIVPAGGASPGTGAASGPTGIVGYVAGFGEPRIALDVGTDAVFFDNPDLPNTRSEMGLPLKTRDQVIGVLDVQSTQAAAFSDEDVAVLQTMADQVALAIDNARLLEESQHALYELEALYGRQVRQAWREQADQQVAYRYTGLGVEPASASVDPEAFAAQAGLRTGTGAGSGSIQDQAPRQDWPVIVEDGDGGTVQRRMVAPIQLRRQTIGSIVLCQDPEGVDWSDEEIALVEEMSTQIGLALENAQLLEQTRQRAEQERIVANITAHVRASMDPETILQTAVRELGAALGTDRAFVHLGASGESQQVEQSGEEDAGFSVRDEKGD
jgi:GAF domain-containing protein/HAMP domain-containing protein